MNPNHDLWEERYRVSNLKDLPWYADDLDPDLKEALAGRGLASGILLDVGTGPGTHAAALSRMGFHVTATDLSETAVQKARDSRGQSETLQFLADDILESSLNGPFDLAFDRGCFHVLSDADRPRYALSMHRLLRSAGLLFLKCFSHKEPAGEGPRRIHPEELRATFSEGFRVEEILETIFQGTRRPDPQALFAVIRRMPTGRSS